MEFKLNEYHRNVSDEELLKDILRIAKSLDKETITIEEYEKNGGKYNHTTISKRFGSWIKAVQLCGLSLAQNQRYNISNEKLIEDLQNVAKQLDKTIITSSEYSRHGLYSKNVFFRRFKTWNNALTMAGLQPFEVPSGKRIDEYKCLEEIERMWIDLGRQPTTTDIKNGISKYSLHAFERRFGSWRKALEFFVAYINGEKEVEKPDETEEIVIPDYQAVILGSDKPKHKTKREPNLRMRFLVLQRDKMLHLWTFSCYNCRTGIAGRPYYTLGKRRRNYY